ncbi:MAG TPA: diaminopimelate decarboxylase [Elusimicrobiota bacterium]|nr:diaminopimelate decarboxylase [Elusimicrobiota bacterium]
MIAYRREKLHLDALSARSLAGRFGTPLYVYSRKTALERLARLRAAFKKLSPLVCYALKANSNRSFCRIFAEQACGAEVVSGGEILRALSAGFKPGTVVYSGVGKTREEIRLALRRRLLAFNVESREELFAIEREAARLKVVAPICPRINADIRTGTHPHVATGEAGNKFGVSPEEALVLARTARQSRWLRVAGLQSHLGSQISSLKPYEALLRNMGELAEELRRRGTVLEFLDIGGGFAVDYEGGGDALDLTGLARIAGKTMKACPDARFIVEPGRYLCADAGALLTRALYRKESFGRKFLIVDAAMNDLARPALYGAKHPVWTERKGAKRERTDVVGPVCESADFLARGVWLPKTMPGELLAVAKAGAYGFSMSSQYNSRPRAAEVLIESGKARVIRRRETMKEIVGLET